MTELHPQVGDEVRSLSHPVFFCGKIAAIWHYQHKLRVVVELDHGLALVIYDPYHELIKFKGSDPTGITFERYVEKSK